MLPARTSLISRSFADPEFGVVFSSSSSALVSIRARQLSIWVAASIRAWRVASFVGSET